MILKAIVTIDKHLHQGKVTPTYVFNVLGGIKLLLLRLSHHQSFF